MNISVSCRKNCRKTRVEMSHLNEIIIVFIGFSSAQTISFSHSNVKEREQTRNETHSHGNETWIVRMWKIDKFLFWARAASGCRMNYDWIAAHDTQRERRRPRWCSSFGMENLNSRRRFSIVWTRFNRFLMRNANNYKSNVERVVQHKYLHKYWQKSVSCERAPSQNTVELFEQRQMFDRRHYQQFTLTQTVQTARSRATTAWMSDDTMRKMNFNFAKTKPQL